MADLLGIELARPGVWQLASGKTTFSVQHLKDAADFYQVTGRQKLGIGLGHNDPRFTGDPSFGNITNVRYEEDARGPVLKGDVVDMPGWLHAAAPSRWPNRSIEGYEDFEYDGRKYRLVLTGLALLGATPPGVQNIRSLQDLQLALAASAARRIVASAPVEEREHVLDDDGLKCLTCERPPPVVVTAHLKDKHNQKSHGNDHGVDNHLGLPVEMVGPDGLQPWNDVTDDAKVESLAESMRDGGWRGPPVVVIPGRDYGWGAGSPIAITGSHRIHAAREAGIEVLTVDLDELLRKHGTSLAEVDEQTGADPDDERHTESVTRLDHFLPGEVIERYGLDAH